MVGQLTWMAEPGPLPPSFHLEPSFPNPFNPSTTIAYALPEPAFVTLGVYDALGRSVRTLVREAEPARRHAVQWNGQDDTGRRVPSGVYLYRLEATAASGAPPHLYSDHKKMVLIQ